MSNLKNSSVRFRHIREELRLTQQELAERLLLSRNYIAQIEMGVKEPSIRVVNALERLLTQQTPFPPPEMLRQAPLKRGDKAPLHLEESGVSYGKVASRIPIQRSPSTRKDCEEYVRALLDCAEQSGNPNAWPVIHDRLQKNFPIREWIQEEP